MKTIVERDALEELLKHPLLEELPRAEGYPVLGSYVLFAQLGSGGMANVFRGVHVRLENEVAIKIRTAPVGTAAARFQREAMVAAKLEHPNLVRATDVDEVAGLQYMVLDYIDGEDADERVARKGALEAREALTIIRDSALGLAEAHRLDFIHRDIKPANVMISREGRVKLADLGLAKSVIDDELGLTATGGILGTPMYMAPEQFRRAEEVVKASDVYGLGVTLIFLLTGRHPFNGKSVPEIMQQVCVQGVAGQERALAALDPRIAALLQEITALKVEDRPADGAALAVRVGEVLAAMGGPVDLSEERAGASKARGVTAPDHAARTRIKAALTGLGSAQGSARGSAGGAAGAKESRSILRWVAAAMLLAAGGGIGWAVLDRQEGGVEGIIDRLRGGAEAGDPPRVSPAADLAQESSSSRPEPAGSGGITMKAADPSGVAIAEALQTAINERAAELAWSEGYADLLTASQESEAENAGPEQVGALVEVAEDFSREFRKARRYKSTSGLLDDAGEEALRGLAKRMSTQAPVTSILAAELGVEFNGLLYEIDPARRETTSSFLRRAAQGDDPKIAARSKFLQGVMLVNDYMSSPRNEDGRRAQDLLTEAARAQPDSEAAAWLGLLYLSFLDQGESEEDVPFWFETDTMLELLEGAVGETSTGDADSVMGHFCSEGLAGVPRSLEAARGHYVNGARRGHIGCVSDAILCGADLERKLQPEQEEKMLHFASNGSDAARMHAREAYALAALTSSFRDASADPERAARAILFLQEIVDAELAQGLITDRQFNRATIALGAMQRASKLYGDPSEEQNRAWLEERIDAFAEEIYSDGFPPRSLPIWLMLADFDPALAKRAVVAAAGESAQATDADALVTFFVEAIDPADYTSVPFVWSFIEPAMQSLSGR